MRISRDEWGLWLAEVVALRSTCLRRSVGCVLVDFDGQVLSTGYNGVGSGEEHCNEEFQAPPSGGATYYPNACSGARAPSGTNLSGCAAIHAEANALIQCRDVRLIGSCYTTVSPCVECVRLLVNTSCTRIVFRTPYAHDELAAERWLRHADRKWLCLPSGLK